MKQYKTLSMVHTAHLHRRICGSIFAEHGISPGMPFILDNLSDDDGCTQKELAERCGLDKSTITSSIRTLERQGLVKRSHSDDDRREKHVHLTEKGKGALEIIATTHDRIEKEALAGFSDEEIRPFTDYISRIMSNLKRVEGEMRK